MSDSTTKTSLNLGLLSGLAVIGTEPGCGKTILMTGLAAALLNQGFSVQAIKPLAIGSKKDMASELSFISTIARTPLDYPYQHVAELKPDRLNSAGWQETMMLIKKKERFTLVELPGSPATPVFVDDEDPGYWKDTARLAVECNLPCLVVGKHAFDALEKLVLSCAYLKMHNLNIKALATVETEPNQSLEPMNPTEFELALFARTKVRYIGSIRHSPSISVERHSQGNLIKMTESGLDLLALIKDLNLPLPVFQR